MPIPKHRRIVPFAIPDDCLTLQQVAAMLGKTPQDVRVMLNRGLLAESKAPGIHKRRLVRKDVLERYARRNGIELKESE